jgi:4-amino-4-deoxy-L-arabinose transferase-like glycosyltransferase
VNAVSRASARITTGVTAMSAKSRRFYLWIGALTVVGLAVRVVYAYHWKWNQGIWGDAFYYHYQANGLVHGDGFATYIAHKNGAVTAAAPSADHPPLFPLYLAAYSLVGLDSFHAHMIASCLLGAGTVWVCGLLGREVVNERVGIITAAIAAVYANLWVHDAIVTSETITIFMVAVMVLAAYRFWKVPTWRRAILLGIACGLGALTRAEVVLFLPLAVIPIVWKLSGESVRKKVKLFVVTCACALLVMMPWLVRNLTTFDKPVFLSTGFGITLASANCGLTYHGELLGWWSIRCVGPPVKGDVSVLDQKYRERGLNYIEGHLSRFPVVVGARIGRMWELFHPGSPWGPVHLNQKIALDFIEGRAIIASRIALAQFYVLAPLAIAGGVILWRRRVTIAPFVALPIIATFAGVIAFGNTRYRAPAEIAIVGLSAVAMDAILSALQRRWGRGRPPDTEPKPDEPRELVGVSNPTP